MLADLAGLLAARCRLLPPAAARAAADQGVDGLKQVAAALYQHCVPGRSAAPHLEARNRVEPGHGGHSGAARLG